ncbi:MAG: molecular chaperone TorD family protein [Chromatiales bacterium]|nr:molecular chaperone TorD family protein [Chromatiales bacterium]
MSYTEFDSRGPGGMGDALDAFRAASSRDTLALAFLHNAELDAEVILKLIDDVEHESVLQLALVSARGREAQELFHAGLAHLGPDPSPADLDELAADYAGIYLNHSLRASPCESVWIDEEGLAMQEAMFQVREYYSRHELATRDWRKRSDDHIVLQLQFVSHLLATGEHFEEIARFLDEHLLRWVSDFAARVASRCATPFYAGLCALTAAYVEELRDLLAEILETPRPSAEEIEKRMKPGVQVALPTSKFVPGSAPSW